MADNQNSKNGEIGAPSNGMKSKILHSFVISAVITVIFIVVVTIAAELTPPLKDFLKTVFYHHWIGKGIVSLGIFAIIGVLCLIFPLGKKDYWISFWIWMLAIAALIGSLAITGFFIYEALIK